MATFRCKPFAGGHMPPPNAGTAIAGPSDWSVVDEGSVNGDILRLDVTAPPQSPLGYKIAYYELALSERDGATTIRRVLGGPALDYVRRFRTDSSVTPQRVQLRTVWQRLNQISWSSTSNPTYTPAVGDTVVQPTNGASATVLTVSGINAGSDYLTLENISGSFADETETLVAGNSGNQGSAIHCTHIDANRETLVSEWSLPRDILPQPGTPQVQITASKTTCLQGEAVILKAFPFGFEAERPTHDLRFRFFVSAAGEQGTYAALPDYFESCFGAGTNNRAEGYTQVWAFAPRTTGTVTVYCEAIDSAGNTATGSIDLTVIPPVSDFADADIYAASAALTPVPGAAGANVYTTLAELEAALPQGGEGLVLLDTNDLHGEGVFTDLFLQDYLTERCVFMPYNATGVGPSAGVRATMNRALTSRAASSATFGLNLIGPYKPADPFSITDFPPHGFNMDLVGYNSIAECDIIGWRENAKLPLPGRKAAYCDVYSTDYHNFGWFGSDVGEHALAGCYTFTNPLSWRSIGKDPASDNATDGFFVDHGPYRSSRPDGARGFSKCVFFSCCSWGGIGYPQNAIRLFGNGNSPKPEVTYGSEVLTEGGIISINSTTRGGGDTTGHPQDVVWEKFFHITSMQPASAMSIGLGGVTVRNGVLATSSNAFEVNEGGVRNHFGFSNESPVPGQNDNENNPVRISFVSVVDLRVDSGQNTQELVLSTNDPTFPMKNVSIENMLTYAPNFTLSDRAAEPLNDTPRWTPLYAGQYFWNAATPTVAAQTPDTSWATPPEVTASFEPRPGSSAYRTASGVIPYDDIRSRVRPVGTVSKGAYDPDAA